MQPTEQRPAPSPQNSPKWATDLVRLLDDAVRIPGTNIRFGLDALIGFIFPSVGDTVTAIGAFSLVLLAFQMRVPKVVLLRMIANIGLDALVGIIPILGDLFDVGFRSNRKNLDLIQRYATDPARKPDALDYLLVAVAILAAIALVVLPIMFAIYVISAVSKAIQ